MQHTFRYFPSLLSFVIIACAAYGTDTFVVVNANWAVGRSTGVFGQSANNQTVDEQHNFVVLPVTGVAGSSTTMTAVQVGPDHWQIVQEIKATTNGDSTNGFAFALANINFHLTLDGTKTVSTSSQVSIMNQGKIAWSVGHTFNCVIDTADSFQNPQCTLAGGSQKLGWNDTTPSPVTGYNGTINMLIPSGLPSSFPADFKVITDITVGCGPFPIDVYKLSTTALFVQDWPTISAQYKPNGGQKLSEAAQACGYTQFEWQQWITQLPCPSPDPPADPSAILNPKNKCSDSTTTPGNLTAPPTINDPPPGGYNLPGLLGIPIPFKVNYNPYPFYYPKAVAGTPNANVNTGFVSHNPFAPTGSQVPVNDNDQTFSFSDRPVDQCLPGGGTGPQSPLSAQRTRLCGGPDSTAPEESQLKFTTALVGILQNGSPVILGQWTWTDDYNGEIGGINVTSQTDNVTVH